MEEEIHDCDGRNSVLCSPARCLDRDVLERGFLTEEGPLFTPASGKAGALVEGNLLIIFCFISVA